MDEPTRVLGNMASAVAAAGVALIPVLPPPWGFAAAGVGVVLSVILTEVNRAKVTPCPPATPAK